MTQRDQLWRECHSHAARGEISQAGELIDRHLRENLEDGEAWQFAGLIRHMMGEFERGKEALETASLLGPLEPMSQFVLAECLAKTGRRARAGELFRDLILDEACPQALLSAVAAGLGQIGEYESALNACVELTRRSPRHAEAHFGIAFYLRRLGKPVETILPIVSTAHELAPAVPLYRVSLAMLLDHVGRNAEALDLLRDLDLDSVSCRGCLRRMATIFRDSRPIHQPRRLPAGAWNSNSSLN